MSEVADDITFLTVVKRSYERGSMPRDISIE